MLDAASSALLVAVAGLLNGSAACGLRAASGAIDLAPITAAADDDLGSAAMAKEESAGRFHWRFPLRQSAIDRKMPLVKYSPCTRARHGVGHGIGANFAGLAGVVLVLLGGPFLPYREPLCHPRVGPLADPRQTSPMVGARQGGVSSVALRAPSDTPPCRNIGGPATPKTPIRLGHGPSLAGSLLYASQPAIGGFSPPLTPLEFFFARNQLIQLWVSWGLLKMG